MTSETQCTKDNPEDWISVVIKRAQNDNPVVPDGIFASLEKLLRGQVSDRKLTPANLKNVASQLLKEMAIEHTEPEETQ